ncbi:MAG: phosphate signaling complex protein PhoU [Burkholderiales bacterium]|nr:phosphate signaling complex protein PhoU [Burkholderiales bacterium]
MSNDHHTSKQYDAELESLRSRVLQMGGMVEQQIVRSIDALSSCNLPLIDQIVADDHKVNALEVEMDEMCNHIIARRQPAAGDLRLIMAVVKTVTDLERIGDEAEKIARMAKLVCESDRLHTPRFTEIRRMGNLALGMVRTALDAFARLDTATAAKVARDDLQLDEEFRAILRQLITFMMEDPRTISLSLEIVFVSKALERIGDHAKNIAEYVVFLVKGKDVRHTTVEQLEREVLG